MGTTDITMKYGLIYSIIILYLCIYNYIIIYIYVHIWRFPKMGDPQTSSILDWDFP